MPPGSDEVWFSGGLRFSCTRCGKCCTGQPGHVWVNDEEVAVLAAHCGEDAIAFRARATRRVGLRRSLREKVNGDCIFYDASAGCTVYSVRPRQCRTWPFWESNVRTPEAWNQTCAVCPGAGAGDLIPAAEITRRLQEIRL
jgi:Fe-S-cluster containining protein